MEDIIRIYPNHRQNKSYPFRFTTEDFDKYNEILNNKILQDNYKKWKNGINYKTNRNIKINGKIHEDLKSIFMIKCKQHNILFNELNSIDFEKYLLETKTIYEDIDNKNKETNIYNNIVDTIIKNINNLDNWNNFIYFETIKYGLPSVVNNIHRENNCCGKIIKDYYESCSCSSCENWNGCNRGGIQYYKCNNCCYKTQNNLGDTRNYKGK